MDKAGGVGQIRRFRRFLSRPSAVALVSGPQNNEKARARSSHGKAANLRAVREAIRADRPAPGASSPLLYTTLCKCEAQTAAAEVQAATQGHACQAGARRFRSWRAADHRRA